MFDSKVVHYTTQHPGYTGPSTHQWAVSCFFQDRVFKREHEADKGVPLDDLEGSVQKIKKAELSSRRQMRALVRRLKQKRKAAATK